MRARPSLRLIAFIAAGLVGSGVVATTAATAATPTPSATITAPTCGANATVGLKNPTSASVIFQIKRSTTSSIVSVTLPTRRFTTRSVTLKGTEQIWVRANNRTIASKWVKPSWTRCRTTTTAKPTTTTSTTTKPTTTTTVVPTTSTTTPSQCAAADKLTLWGCPTLVDSFDSPAIDTTPGRGWSVYNFPNDAKRPRVAGNVTVANSMMKLDGTYSQATGKAVGAGVMNRYQQKFGRYEVRAKIDKAAGFSAVSLLWPDKDMWPINGEIDMFEVPGADRSRIWTATHNGKDNAQRARWTTVDASQWHTYAVEWTPSKVVFFVDNKAVYTETYSVVIPSASTMHLTLQMDSGCDGWYTCPNSTTPPVQSMYVDYVKIWSYKS